MPIYEYRCEPCQHRFEDFLSASTEQAVCPKCNATQLKRLMSTFAATVVGGYKSTTAASAAPAASDAAAPAPKAGGCGGGCACH